MFRKSSVFFAPIKGNPKQTRKKKRTEKKKKKNQHQDNTFTHELIITLHLSMFMPASGQFPREF